MPLADLVPDRLRKLIHEATKFGLVGIFNFFVNFAVFIALAATIFSDGQLKASVVATVVATTTSYFMNRYWTYRDRPKSALRREYVLFFMFNLAGMLIELGVLGLAKYGLGITSLALLTVARLGGVGLGTVFRFWSYRTFVFRKAPEPAPAVDDPAPATAGAVPAQAQPAGRTEAGEFSALTAALEVEIDPPLDAALAAELDSAALDPAGRRRP